MEYSSVIAALADPAFYPHRPDRVEHLQTHISHVFLAGPYVYKLKKAVRFSFLDFSTVERRHHFCREEIRLNRRLCPAVYLDVLPITSEPGGALRLGGAGPTVDYVVRMRRLPASGMLINRVREGRLPVEVVDRLAHTLAAFHAQAANGPAVTAYAAPDALRGRWEDNMQAARASLGRLLASEDYDILADFGPSFVREHESLLRARQAQGRIRDGHGDLHCDNVCVLDERHDDHVSPPLEPGLYIFDCIEFSDALRCNDVASEVAFLAMDLESLGRHDLARRFVASYTAAADDPLVPVLLPFYACYRACVRAKVEGLVLAEVDAQDPAYHQAATRARAHYALAVRYAWRAYGPAIVACAGLSGTGKSTLADILAEATGYERISSDAIRKHPALFPPDPALQPAAPGSGLYELGQRMATYGALCQQVEEAVAAHHGVIADATFIKWSNRLKIAAIARRHQCPHVFLECQADEATVRVRLLERDRSPTDSDARWETYCTQRDERDPFGAGESHLSVDTTGDLSTLRATALRRLWQWRKDNGRSGRAGERSEPSTERAVRKSA